MYIGRIWLSKTTPGISAVVFLAQPTDGGGSYWMYFDQWTAEDKKGVPALLLGAKLAGHRVDLETTNPDKCGIASGGTSAAAVYVSNFP